MRGVQFLQSLEQWNGQGGFSPDNLRKVLRHLGDPQDSIPAVHTAGTNGKGSVSAAVASMLGAAGWRVGMNISPHLHSFNERIVIDGLPVSDEVLDAAAFDLMKVLEKLGAALTYHEALTAIAFLIFKELGLDWIVIEVGLGGRLDASNVLSRPEACIITSIGLDHQHILGATRPEIAREKAGIIKRGSLLFTGKIDAESLEVIQEVAEEKGISHVMWGKHYEGHLLPRIAGSACNGYAVKYVDSVKGESFLYHPSLKGAFQVPNMALALNVARSLGVSEKDCIHGVENVFWPARFEKVSYNNSLIIFDCAHNIDGISALTESLDFEGIRGLPIAFGCLDTKNWHEMMELLRPYVTEWNLLLPQSTRAVPNREVMEALSCSGVKAIDFGTDYEGFLKSRPEGEPLLVAGSMYMVGAVRSLVVGEERILWHRGRKGSYAAQDKNRRI